MSAFGTLRFLGLRQCGLASVPSAVLRRSAASSISTSCVQQVENEERKHQQKMAGFLKTEVELTQDKAVKDVVTVEGASDVGTTSGIPEEHIRERYVRIFRPAKSAMQSGTAGVRRWRIEFEGRERWENNLMGWTSSADPLANTVVEFADKDEAVAFVEKHGWDYWVEDPKERAPKAKSYSLNFAWNKRTRKSTK